MSSYIKYMLPSICAKQLIFNKHLTKEILKPRGNQITDVLLWVEFSNHSRRKRLIKTSNRFNRFYYVIITITCVVDFGNRITV